MAVVCRLFRSRNNRPRFGIFRVDRSKLIGTLGISTPEELCLIVGKATLERKRQHWRLEELRESARTAHQQLQQSWNTIHSDDPKIPYYPPPVELHELLSEIKTCETAIKRCTQDLQDAGVE